MRAWRYLPLVTLGLVVDAAMPEDEARGHLRRALGRNVHFDWNTRVPVAMRTLPMGYVHSQYVAQESYIKVVINGTDICLEDQNDDQRALQVYRTLHWGLCVAAGCFSSLSRHGTAPRGPDLHGAPRGRVSTGRTQNCRGYDFR